MKYKWLNQEHNSKIIVFFNGWGMDESIVKHLEPQKFDVLMFYDYNSLETDFNFDLLKKYNSAHLVAWSMGVMTATHFEDVYTTKTAINGTLSPIDDKFGIPKKIYDLTLKGFSKNGADKFIKNMFADIKTYPIVNRTIENQTQELHALCEYTSNMDYKYTKILISDSDKIIPTKNQVVFWGINPNVQGGHAIFHNFKNWSELL